MSAHKELSQEEQKIQDVLKSEPDIQLALLFGSVAAGTASINSDVDIAIQKAQHFKCQR